MNRKGITPVIATVLLLGITLAIGMTLYTQVEGLLGDQSGQTDELDRIQSTDMKLNPTYSGQDNQIVLNIVNTGERAINVSDFTAHYGPGDFDNPVPYNVLPAEHKVSANDNQCFTLQMQETVINPGDSTSCKTGIVFPDALDEVKISVEANDFDKSWTTSCVPQTSSSRSC